MKQVFKTVNLLAAGVQLLGDLKGPLLNFKNNVRRNRNDPSPKYKQLFTPEMINKAYLNPALQLKNFGHFIIVNARYTAVAAVQGNTSKTRKTVVLEFKENRAMSIDDILQLLSTYPAATLSVNDNGEGKFLGQLLKKNGIWYMPVHWGGNCFSNDNRKEYVNKRAQSYACLSYAVNTYSFKICQPHNNEKVLKELKSIRYSFDERSRFRIMPVSEMREIGLDVPDIADLFAQIFLEGTAYSLELNSPDLSTPANNTQSD
ncbi:hypothetical protein [Acinetobacter pragensis]|uniref:Uncharacterized protein n=1 Tax=Acinetobacter pragensis TaxID=1806892 RepID=A0A151Y5H0_9GAMM|nr:hypothetical protein [Acinetobacter pragensis]KYQ73239.1 hypothetical protein AZH43_07390 [Acinetobacter pragensis]